MNTLNLNTIFDNFENEKKIEEIIYYLNNKKINNLDSYLKILFILVDFVVEDTYTEEEFEVAIENIRLVYKKLIDNYDENPEFLFFCGIIIYMGEWAFNLNIEEGTKMLKKAHDLVPDCNLFKWGYISMPNQKAEINTIEKYQVSKNILEDDKLLDYLKKKGNMGEYILGFIEATFIKTKNILNSKN